MRSIRAVARVDFRSILQLAIIALRVEHAKSEPLFGDAKTPLKGPNAAAGVGES